MNLNRIIKLAGLFLIASALFFSCEDDPDDATTWITPTFHTTGPAADTVKVTVFSVFEWQVVIADDCDWVETSKIGPQAPSKDDSVFVYIKRNESRATRKTDLNISFTVGGYSDRVFSITQTGVADLIDISTEDIRVNKTAQSKKIVLESNIEWEIVKPTPAWLENIARNEKGYDSETGMDTWEITFDVAANPEPYYRLDSLELRGKGLGPEGNDVTDIVDYISIFQDGNSDFKSDSTYLRKLYDATNGANWTTKWDITKEVAQWSGVEIGSVEVSVGSELRVISVDLSNNNLVGTLPTEFFQLPFLRRLWLQDNVIAGNLPNNFVAMIDLQNINLSNNVDLTGGLPASIGNLVNMISFTIANTKMSGTLPDSFGEMKKLTDMDLSGNDFSGELPISLGENYELKNLFLRGNKFTGEVPGVYKNNINWYDWNVEEYICPQKSGFGFTNCSEF